MAKNGHNNPAFVGEPGRKTNKYSLELVEKGGKYDSCAKENDDSSYNPYEHRVVQHPTT